MKFSSISNATGWWAAYGEYGHAFFQRVVVWVVTADPDDPEADIVDGLDIIDMYGGGVSTIRQSSDFRGFFRDSDFEIVGKKLKVDAMDLFNKGM